MDKKTKTTELFAKTQNLFNKTKEKVKDKATHFAVKNIAQDADDSEETKSYQEQLNEQVLAAVNINESTQLYMKKIIEEGMKNHCNVINRTDFLQENLQKYCSQDIIDNAICESPMNANISPNIVDTLADITIKTETAYIANIDLYNKAMEENFLQYNNENLINTKTKSEEGTSEIANAEINQTKTNYTTHYCYGLLRTTQKLLYLYGFPQMEMNQNNMDNITNTLTVCFGVMYGINGTSNALQSISSMLASGVKKQLAKNDSILNSNIIAIANKVSKWFDIEITKENLSGIV